MVTSLNRHESYNISRMLTQESNSGALEELYKCLPQDVAAVLRQRETRVTVPAKTKLVCYGRQPEHLIMLFTGSVDILLPCGKQAIVLSTAGPGKIFGLRALVSDRLPEIDAICRTECTLRLLPRDMFVRALESHPEMYFSIAKLLSEDLQLAHAYLKKRNKSA